MSLFICGVCMSGKSVRMFLVVLECGIMFRRVGCSVLLRDVMVMRWCFFRCRFGVLMSWWWVFISVWYVGIGGERIERWLRCGFVVLLFCFWGLGVFGVWCLKFYVDLVEELFLVVLIFMMIKYVKFICILL